MEADPNFEMKKILYVKQVIQTVVGYELLHEDGSTSLHEVLTSSHDRPLPDPEPVEV